MAKEARRRGVDGVVCGHIHRAELREIDGIVYANDGDWVESLTALAEHADGRLEIIDWSARRNAPAVAKTVPVAAAIADRDRRLRIAIVSDAWRPQVNGVVTTLVDLQQQLGSSGHEVAVIEPTSFRRLPCPFYPEIELAWRPRRRLERRLDELRPTPSTSPPKGRSASPLARTAAATTCVSRPPSTPAFPNS